MTINNKKDYRERRTEALERRKNWAVAKIEFRGNRLFVNDQEIVISARMSQQDQQPLWKRIKWAIRGR